MKALLALLVFTPQLVWASEPGEPSSGDAASRSDVSDASPPGAEAAGGPEAAPESDASGGVSYGAEVDVASRYVWRGLAFSEDPVMQPSGRISEYGATLGMASNAYLGDDPGAEHQFSELDLLGNYDLVLGDATLSPSFGAYIYPDAPDTAELGTTLRYNLDLIVLQTRQSLDIADNAGGWYGDVGAVRSQALGPKLTLEAMGSLAWCSGSFGRYYIDPSIHGLHFGAAEFDSSLVLAATRGLYFRLHGTFSRMLESEIREFATDDNLVSGGLALGLAR